MKFTLKATTAVASLTIAALSASSAHGQSHGYWKDYFPSGKSYYFQHPSNGLVYGPASILDVPGGQDHYHSGPSQTACGSDVLVEMMRVKTCSMKSMATGAITSADFVVLLGHRGMDGRQYLLDVATHNGEKATRFYVDNNNSFTVDPGDTGYFVDCPGLGQPYTMAQVQDTQNILQTWYRQDVSSVGTSYTARIFWESIVSPPENKFNENWGTTGATAESVIHHDAFWCASDDGSGCPVGGHWTEGGGTTATLSDGQVWPDGANVGIGRNIWHARNIGPVWWQDTWFPYTFSSGLDRAEPFAGC